MLHVETDMRHSQEIERFQTTHGWISLGKGNEVESGDWFGIFRIVYHELQREQISELLVRDPGKVK